jgi:hypothetical protein
MFFPPAQCKLKRNIFTKSDTLVAHTSKTSQRPPPKDRLFPGKDPKRGGGRRKKPSRKARAIIHHLSRQVREKYDSKRNKPVSSRPNNEFERRPDFLVPLVPQNNLHRNSNT